jgi:hypothetical protein
VSQALLAEAIIKAQVEQAGKQSKPEGVEASVAVATCSPKNRSTEEDDKDAILIAELESILGKQKRRKCKVVAKSWVHGPI